MSNTRKPRSSRRPTRTASSSTPQRPFRSIQSQMTFDHFRAVEDASAAELRGDWSTAFERHRVVPMWSQSRHGGHLKVIADLGADAPGWLRTRFLTTLVSRWETYGQPQRTGRVMQQVLPHLYPDGIPFDVIGCEHPEQVPAWIYARDWVVRQADVYEYGGLADLVHHAPAAGAVATGELVGEWCRSAMGGYRVVGARDGVLTLADAATGVDVDVLDLGLTEQVAPGAHVLGRLVPTSSEPGRVFDWRPLPVPARTAHLVAERPDDWLATLGLEVRAGRLQPGFAHLSDTSLTADLPQHSWGVLRGVGIDDQPVVGRGDAGKALEAALGLDVDGVRRRRHVIAELLLDEALDDRTISRHLRPEHAAGWERLAAEVSLHAVARCKEAAWLSGAASDGLAG